MTRQCKPGILLFIVLEWFKTKNRLLYRLCSKWIFHIQVFHHFIHRIPEAVYIQSIKSDTGSYRQVRYL